MQKIVLAAVAALACSFSGSARAGLAPWIGPTSATSWLVAPPHPRHRVVVVTRHHHHRHHEIVRAPARHTPEPVGQVDPIAALGKFLGLDGWADGMASGPRRLAAPAIIKPIGGGLVLARVADGQRIRVDARFADRFLGFFQDLYDTYGRLPEIGCYSMGHQPGSLHHHGDACDVGQTARNVADRMMYHVTAIANRHGLTDGCTWHRDPRGPDCGHVDVSNVVGNWVGPRSSRYARRWRVHYAHRWRQRHYAGA